MIKKLKTILWEQRNSARLAYVLHFVTRLATSALNLVWIRLLVGAMGQQLNSLYLAFQSVVTLGGLGDLGMGGAVGIRTGQYLGQGKEAELKKFLASARAAFLILALLAGGGMLALSPWLPHWLGFKEVPATGTVDFATNDFINVPALAARLYLPRQTDRVSAYISAQLSPETRELLFGNPGQANARLREMLAADFNRISREPGFYQPERFENARLSAETQALLKANAGAVNARATEPAAVDGRVSAGTGPEPRVGAVAAIVCDGRGADRGHFAFQLHEQCELCVRQRDVAGAAAVRDAALDDAGPMAAGATGAAVVDPIYSRRAAGRRGGPVADVVLCPRLASGRWPTCCRWRWIGGMMVTLFESSFWVYLCSLGNLIYRSTDAR